MKRARRVPAFLFALVLPFLCSTAHLSAATIQVDSTADDLDVSPNGNCTLREAIVAANTNSAVDNCAAGAGAPTIDVIQIPAGTYLLTIGPDGDDDAQFGDLDLRDGVELIGAGARTTIIDGNQLDRVIDIGGSVRGSIQDLTIRGGDSPGNGGGIENGGVFFLERVAIVGNHASGPGGGIRNDLSLELRRSILLSNSTDDHGGGIDNHGVALFENVTVSGNTVNGGVGGGIYVNDGEELTLIASTVADNSASAGGDAVNNLGNLTVTGSILVGGCNGTVTSNGGNLESPGDTCGLTNGVDLIAVGDPMLTVLADHGGPTDTYAPVVGSPAIDAMGKLPCPFEDQRGFARPFDGDGDTVAECDAGAVEVGASPILFADGFETGDPSAWSNF